MKYQYKGTILEILELSIVIENRIYFNLSTKLITILLLCIGSKTDFLGCVPF